jgi:hypothetical protein
VPIQVEITNTCEKVFDIYTLTCASPCSLVSVFFKYKWYLMRWKCYILILFEAGATKIRQVPAGPSLAPMFYTMLERFEQQKKPKELLESAIAQHSWCIFVPCVCSVSTIPQIRANAFLHCGQVVLAHIQLFREVLSTWPCNFLFYFFTELDLSELNYWWQLYLLGCSSVQRKKFNNPFRNSCMWNCSKTTLWNIVVVNNAVFLHIRNKNLLFSLYLS